MLEAFQLSPAVRATRWRCLDGAPLGHVAGQWVDLYFPVGGESMKRSYSIASAPGETAPDEFLIAVTRVAGGAGSAALHALSVGAQLEMRGPDGFFTREILRTQPALFVGTGTGVCPLRAMIVAALAVEGGPSLALLFGCRHEEDILWRQQFEDLANHDPRFDFQVTLSRPSDDWTGRSGYVQTHLSELVDTAVRPHVYVCGLERMIRQARSTLKGELGYDRSHIHSERYD